MSSKRLHYSDEKWLDLISECRSSGLSDKDWCMEHQIGISTFYYHVKRLCNKACSIPPAAVGAVIPCQKQEVVELNFNPVSELPMNCSSEEITATAIKISMHGIHVSLLRKRLPKNQGFTLRQRRFCPDAKSSGRFQWPRNASEARLLTRQEFRWLMEGLAIDQPKAIKAGSRKKDF